MSDVVKMDKWFHFNQNNSGGSFVNDEERGLTHHVFIQAVNYQHANMLAEEIGIYFDGCETGMDCSCCGDRWYPAWDKEGTEVPELYGQSVYEPEKESDFPMIQWSNAEIVLHHADGTIQWMVRPGVFWVDMKEVPVSEMLPPAKPALVAKNPGKDDLRSTL